MINIHEKKGKVILSSDDLSIVISLEIKDSSIYNDRALITFYNKIEKEFFENMLKQLEDRSSVTFVLNDMILVARVEKIVLASLEMVYINFKKTDNGHMLVTIENSSDFKTIVSMY